MKRSQTKGLKCQWFSPWGGGVKKQKKKQKKSHVMGVVKVCLGY
jgi:hypothetical protein